MKTGDSSCGHCHHQHQLCARKVPIFSVLDEEELSKVTALIKRKKYDKSEVILREGSNSDSLIFINHGMAKAFRYTQEGKEQILYIFSEGDFFGEKNLLAGQEAAYHVEALEKTDVCMISNHDFQLLMREYPGISIKIIQELCARLDRLERVVRAMGAQNVEARISAVLLEFAEKYGTASSGGGIQFELPFSREGVANYIGVARETVSRRFIHLQEEGIIDMIGNKKIIIKNKDVLRKEIE